MSAYVELAVRSNFSFLQAASFPEELMEAAAALGYGALGLTDCDGLYGMVRAHQAAERCGVKLIVGCDLTIDLTIDQGPATAQVLVYVRDRHGYTNLCRLLTESHRRYRKGNVRPRADGTARNCHAGLPLPHLCDHPEGLSALTFVTHPEVLGPLRDAFGERLSLGVFRHRDGSDHAREGAIVTAATTFGIPLCATNAVRYRRPTAKRLYDVLYCIREGITLTEAGRALAPNAEAHLKSPAAMARIFSDHPAWIERSGSVAAGCDFSLRELRYQFPSEHGEGHLSNETNETPDQRLRRLTFAGAQSRYGYSILPAVHDQLEKELCLIAQLEVAPYFLSVQAVVQMARERDILCQGRGSAANSAVCYCLGITAVDPARSSLLFERFLSADRREPPDIDVDFEHERREEVIQAIYETYGRDRAAMVSEVICYRGKSALREVAKVFGFADEAVGRLRGIVTHSQAADADRPERLRAAGFDPDDLRVRRIVAVAQALRGYPRHLSVHVGGFVLSAEPLTNVAPVEPATMAGRTVIPWDKDDLDALGFFKVDVLGLGMLTALRKTLALVQHDPRVQAPTAIEQLARVPPEDPPVYEALQRADSVGVFQVESRAQMAMLPRLRPRAFYDLVVEVAIVRPGPIQGGMVHPYLRRRNGEEDATAPHALLAPILDRTLGVPIFQEQVMQIAVVGAGYTAGEADQLRRDMAAWKKEGNLEKHRDRLLKGFAERGIPSEFADRLYGQMLGFGEYGFPESHAASFALLVYASTWLKVHHPAAFTASLINSQPMGFYRPSTLLQDAQRHGVEVRPISVTESAWDCTLEGPRNAPAIRLGLRMVRGLGEKAARRIVHAVQRGDVDSLGALRHRAKLSPRDLTLLAEAGALEPLQPGRPAALWEAHRETDGELFQNVTVWGPPAELPRLTRGRQLMLDYERTGVSVTDHPMGLARPELPASLRRACDLPSLPHGAPVQTAGLVICRQRPQTASGVVFLTLEDETGFLNAVVFVHVYEAYRAVIIGHSLLQIGGKIERNGEVIYVVVARASPLRQRTLRVGSMSRDFH